MKPPAIPLEEIIALPLIYQTTIPPEYRDENGHMNVRWYMMIFDEAGYPFVAMLGITPEFHQQHGTGGFDLEHHLHYLNEVHVGDKIAVYVRVLGRSAKRIHYMMFMVNETRGTLASTFECVNSFADLTVRRTALYPPEIAAKIDALLAQHQALHWDAPVCGVMGA
ncbi:MAG TPA: thioesterase family protein [Oceanobacillus sp.]|nr:thioesterase family protein [Oceanobacillus sp.]